MSTSKNTGVCLLCKKEVEHRAIKKHIGQCIEKAAPASSPTHSSEKEKIFLMTVYAGKLFWLYIEINGSASLEKLDNLLRNTWLECCGHLSQFTIHGVHYSSDGGEGEDERMTKKIQQVFDVGTKFSYEYDFGSTTDLEGKVIAIRQGKLKEGLRLLARNNLPESIVCTTCQKKPEVVCSACFDFCCKPCQKKHTNCEGEDYMLPVVNSPRMGVCGYTGED